MSYEHDLVERAALALALQQPTFESLLRRRDRKRRNQRLAAGAVGLAIGIGVIVLTSAVLRSAGTRETGEWPPPAITTTRLVRPGEVLLDPYASGDNPTYVIAADVATGAQRTVAGCKAGCRLLTPFDASADGGWIAYHLANCEEGECGPTDPKGGLWVVGAGGTPRFVAEGVQDTPWSWSPTGAQLAYADADAVILLDPTTWEHTRIATVRGALRTIAWGPGGRSIAYSVDSIGTGDAGPGVFVVRSGGEPERVSDEGGAEGIRWSPDGGALLPRSSREQPECDRGRRSGRLRRASAGGGPDGRGAGGAGVVAGREPDRLHPNAEGRRCVSHRDLGDRCRRAGSETPRHRRLRNMGGRSGVVARFDARRMVVGLRRSLGGGGC
jgi:hypothetical protein